MTYCMSQTLVLLLSTCVNKNKKKKKKVSKAVTPHQDIAVFLLNYILTRDIITETNFEEKKCRSISYDKNRKS